MAPPLRYTLNGVEHELSDAELMAVEETGRSSLGQYLTSSRPATGRAFSEVKVMRAHMRFRPDPTKHGSRPAQLGPPPPKNDNNWTALEEQVLKQIYPIEGVYGAMCRLGRTRRSVSDKAYSLGLKIIGPSAQWPEEREQKLIKLRGAGYSYLRIAELMGRSYDSIRSKVQSLREKGRL